MGLPRIILHNAVSVDGRIDWFTPDLGRYYGLVSRWHEDATLAGSDTILAQEDNVASDAGDTSGGATDKSMDNERPLLVIPDSRGRVRSWHLWRRQPYWRDMVALCSESTPDEYIDYLDEQRIHRIIAGKELVNFKQALQELCVRFGVETVRVESGGSLNGVLLREGLVDEVSVLIHPALVGGSSPRSLFRAPDLFSDEGVISLELVHFERFDDDIVWLLYRTGKA